MSGSFTAKALLDELEAITTDAWCSAPTPEQAKELWRCIWDGGDDLLGYTLVPEPTRLRVRSLAEAADSWWCWTVAGDPFVVTLAGAQAMFRDDVPEMSADAAAEYLRELSAKLDDVGKRAVGKAIAALRRG
jgi:hypothetical protein